MSAPRRKRLSPTQRAILVRAADDPRGRAYAPQRSIAPLVGAGLMSAPHYAYGLGQSWAVITVAGMAALGRNAETEHADDT